MGRVGIRLGQGCGPAEPGPQAGEAWRGPSRPFPDTGLRWHRRAPLGQMRPYLGSWLQGKDLGPPGIFCVMGTAMVCRSQVLLGAGTGVTVPLPASQWPAGVTVLVLMAKPLLTPDWGAESSPRSAFDLCGDVDMPTPVGDLRGSPAIEKRP